jgi:DNA polymerase-1
MPLFDLPSRAGRSKDISTAKRVKSTVKKSTVIKGGGLLGRIAEIKAMVEKTLGDYKDKYVVIEDEKELHKYITAIINNCIYALDTETTGLDPLLDKIAGVGIYTPNKKAAYIPINHVSYITGMPVEGQLPVEVVRKEFERINSAKGMQCVMFNAAFDIRVMKNQVGVLLTCTWDDYLAARLLNENEGNGNNGLKALYKKYVLNGEGDAFSFESLFKDIKFTMIPINIAYLYAAHDPEITYLLYEYQRPFLTETDSECINRELVDVARVFHNIEMPCVPVVAEMEDTGVEFDFKYAEKLSTKYHTELDKRIDKFYELLDEYSDEIESYRMKNMNNKLDDPINIASPTQIAILLYDILKLQSPDKKQPRGTGEAILADMDNPICKAILDYRETSKLISTYIDKLPECVNPNDGRIHCNFNQYGADTGRFSSSDPNLQNIPSHNKDIRKMFKARDGYVMMSSDYSQQEPKVMTQMCGDKGMIQAYMEGKDLYAEIASLSFNKPYEECLEFRPDGTTNPDGKARRTQAKSILLGVLYGRGVPSIAEQLKVPTKKAQEIKDSVFKGFPAIPKFEQDSLEMARENGFVTTLWGRKRRLPELQLPTYEFKWKDGAAPNDDYLDFDSDEEVSTEVPESLQEKYLKKLAKCKFWDKQRVFQEANDEGVWVIDNSMKIADAERQCVNARIQGSAADMSKLAMIKVGTDKRLHDLGFRLLIPVHDELIAECPEDVAEECAERFTSLMSQAAGEKLTIPIKCDVEITKCWYGESIDGGKKNVRETTTARQLENELKKRKPR